MRLGARDTLSMVEVTATWMGTDVTESTPLLSSLPYASHYPGSDCLLEIPAFCSLKTVRLSYVVHFRNCCGALEGILAVVLNWDDSVAHIKLPSHLAQHAGIHIY